jgi:hypothetical protein
MAAGPYVIAPVGDGEARNRLPGKETMNGTICEICGVNDCIVYIEKPDGTFCYKCDGMVTHILDSSLEDDMKQALIDDLKQTKRPTETLTRLYEYFSEAPPLGATASATGAASAGA